MPPAATISWEQGWGRIYEHGILRLQSMIKGGYDDKASFTNKEYVDLYSIVYNMCIQKAPNSFTPQLYEEYKKCINDYLMDVTLPAIQSQRGAFMVQELVQRWEDHKIMKKWLFDFFRYIDKFYVKRASLPPLQTVCVERFKMLVFDETKTRITEALLDLIQKDRNKEVVDRSLLQQAIRIYVDMGMDNTNLYGSEFEGPFIQATSEYYLRESAKWLESDSTPDYLRKAEISFAQERKRLKDFLHPNSEEKLMTTLYEAVLLKHQTEILDKENTGCRVMLEAHAEKDLSRMFNLYSLSPDSLPPIGEDVRKHISAVGNKLIDKVNEQKSHAGFVETLMEIHEKYYNLVLKCFKDHPIFQKALKEAFEEIVNKGTEQSSTAELLADYTNTLLQKGGNRMEDKELEDTLDKVVRLFTYLSDKDIFSEFYRKLLAKRLLLQRSESVESEKSMIGKLKLRCGAQYTSKLEGMINDMSSAVEHQQEFEEFLSRSPDIGCDFQVQTLTTGFWPSYAEDNVKFPPNMERCLELFKTFYNNKTHDRKLMWIHKLGEVTIAGNYKKRKIDLVVSAIQAAIMMLFNETTTLSIDAITQHTGLDAENVKRQLRSLVSGKFKVLSKTPESGYKTTHMISVNQNFVCAQRKVRIPNAVAKTTAKERNATKVAVQEDRRHAIEASIVRIMKARKSLEHSNLVVEVSQHLMQYFKPDPRQIKKRIADLITREYLERDAENTTLYHYLA